uniref:Uncharacterized protein n=1 Tax=Laticauda laticaudata TaxID=8630 RepID=A0A8C5S0E5_LATLA
MLIKSTLQNSSPNGCFEKKKKQHLPSPPSLPKLHTEYDKEIHHLYGGICDCVHVCVREKERQRDTERERQSDRHTQRQREREREEERGMLLKKKIKMAPNSVMSMHH